MQTKATKATKSFIIAATLSLLSLSQFVLADECAHPLDISVKASPSIINANSADAKIEITFDADDIGAADKVSYTLEIFRAAKDETKIGKSLFTEKGEIAAEKKEEIYVFPNKVIDWNGKTDHGGTLRSGTYFVRVTSRCSNSKNKKKATETAYDLIKIATNKQLLSLKTGGGVVLGAGTNKPKNVALVKDFPFKFYYGQTHCHTRFSDGGVPCAKCKKAALGPHDGAEPEDAYKYAKDKGLLDFLAIVEHNHVMEDVCSTCTKPKDVLDLYHRGCRAAANATIPDEFVGIYGMEWGKTSTGHVNIYNQPKLISWSNDPNAHKEKLYPRDVTVGYCKYGELFKAIAENQPPEGSYATLNHPQNTDFDSFKRGKYGDEVVRGIAVVSGPATTNLEDFDASLNHTRFRRQFYNALATGWKLAPEAHQDNHCWNYGTASSARTVAIVPKDQEFNLKNLMDAFGKRHFFATTDRNAQLKFATKDGEHVMGDQFDADDSLNVVVQVVDPDDEDAATITLYGGPIGSGEKEGKLLRIEGENEVTITLEPQPGEQWYYVIEVTQPDQERIYSAPMWISWQ